MSQQPIAVPPQPDSPTVAPPSDGSLMCQFRTGHPLGAEQLYRCYAERIRVLVRNNMSRGLAGRLEVEDIVQSVFRRFFDAAGRGLYQIPSGEELGNLLVAITLNRVRSEEQFQRAAKRDLRQTVGGDVLEGLTDPNGGTDSRLEAFLEVTVAELIEQLPEQHRELVRLRMEGYEVAEIATRIGRSKRTVERMLQETRTRLQAFVE